MSGTLVFDKKLFLEQMGKLVEDDEFVIFSNILYGNMTAASKKIAAKRIGIAFAGSVFKVPETIGDLLNSKVAGIIVCKKSRLSDDMQKQIKDFRKNQ